MLLTVAVFLEAAPTPNLAKSTLITLMVKAKVDLAVHWFKLHKVKFYNSFKTSSLVPMKEKIESYPETNLWAAVSKESASAVISAEFIKEIAVVGEMRWIPLLDSDPECW